MRIVGLTGGIASGKSSVARVLTELGAAVVDADLLAREVVAPGQPALDDIRRLFGPEYIDDGGALDRQKIAAVVFSDPEKRRLLESITHPRIAALAQARLAEHRERGVEVAFYEAALLVENGLHERLDATIVVAVPEDTQIERLMARDQLTREQAQARLGSQLPLEAKVKVATYVVDNSGAPAETTRQVKELWHKLREDGD